MRRTGLVLLGIALLLVIGRFVLGSVRGPNDVQLVKDAIAEATKASREGRAGAVFENLSIEASLNGQTADRRSIGDVIKRAKPDLTLDTIEPQIIGDEARVTSPAKITVGILAAKQSYDLAKITVVLKKENEPQWLIFPGHRWRVTRVDVPEETIAPLAAQFAGAALGGGFGF